MSPHFVIHQLNLELFFGQAVLIMDHRRTDVEIEIAIRLDDSTALKFLKCKILLDRSGK